MFELLRGKIISQELVKYYINPIVEYIVFLPIYHQSSTEYLHSLTLLMCVN